jgi:hypothetical protein
MDFTQTIVIAIALSAPIVILIGVGRTIMCLDRSIRAKRTRFAILSGLNILILLALLAAIIVVWFAYGVAHTGKDATTDLMVLASTVTPAYVGVFLIWLLSRRFEKGLRRDGD